MAAVAVPAVAAADETGDVSATAVLVAAGDDDNVDEPGAGKVGGVDDDCRLLQHGLVLCEPAEQDLALKVGQRAVWAETGWLN